MQTSELTETSTETSARPHRLLMGYAPSALTVIALITGTVLRWSRLGARSFWFDEGYTAWVVSRPVGQIIRIIRADTAPPLYYLILREWTLIFGRSEAAMRSLSALFATLTLIVFTAIARRILEKPWAVTAAVWLFSLSFMQIAYAHEARFYAMMAFLGAVDLYLVLLVCERSSPWRLAALGLAWTASLYANNMMVVYLACLGGAWIFFPRHRPIPRRLLDLLIVGGISSLAFAPWVPSLLEQVAAVRGHFWALAPTWLDLESTIAAMAGVRDQSVGDFVIGKSTVAGVVVVDCAILVALLTTVRSRRAIASGIGLALFGVFPILSIYFYSQFARSIYMDRAFIVSGITMPLLAALPLAAVFRQGRRVALTAGLAVLLWLSISSLPTVWLGTQDEDWRAAMAYTVQSPARHRLVVFVANEGELFYDYYVRVGDYSPRADLIGCPASFFAVDPPHTMRDVESDNDVGDLRRRLDVGQFDELVFVASHNWFADPSHRTLTLLQSRLPLLDQKTISRMTIFRFGPAKR